jgi:indole-3-glycerol phosphate synthase
MQHERKSETNFIFTLANSARQNIAEGYYYHHNNNSNKHYRDPGEAQEEGDNKEKKKEEKRGKEHRSLRRAIVRSRRTPLVAEIKFTSPAEGKLREVGDVAAIARAYESGGVVGISVLTEPRHFEGDIRYIPLVKRSVGVPVLMKDIVIDPVQVDAAVQVGADAILFIAAIFMNRLANESLEKMLARAHDGGLEVLLEAHTENEYLFALESGADIIGINNRNLDTLEVSLETSRRLLATGRGERERLRIAGKDAPVISESGITTRRDIVELRSLGADGFLVGSALMRSKDLELQVRSLTGD